MSYPMTNSRKYGLESENCVEGSLLGSSVLNYAPNSYSLYCPMRGPSYRHPQVGEMHGPQYSAKVGDGIILNHVMYRDQIKGI